MRYLVMLVVIAGLAPAAFAAAPSTPTGAGKGVILLVRHAERPPGPPADDPSLTAEGAARAKRLAAVLAKAGVDAVFTTRFRRTQETAKPAAELLRLTPLVESDTEQLITQLRTRADDTVLVVGHSDTIPDVIRAFGGPAVTIGDDEFDALFVLVPSTGALTRLVY